jgi:hypothetical protein
MVPAHPHSGSMVGKQDRFGIRDPWSGSDFWSA